MSRVDLEAIKARLAAATPGPWAAEYSAAHGNCVVPADAESTREAVCVTRLFHGAADADLIAHAPTDLAALVAEVERLRGHRAHLIYLLAVAVCTHRHPAHMANSGRPCPFCDCHALNTAHEALDGDTDA